MNQLGQINIAGKEAGRAGLQHTANPHPKGSCEELAWFHAWHVATVERETGQKLLPDLPDAGSGLLMFAQKEDL